MRRRSPLFWLGMFWLLRRFMRRGPWGRGYGYGFGGPRGYRRHSGHHYL
ncbi:MAG TPA: hypothetical protein VGR57_05380 [Ktedonobacterales bacterium]|nr:hypothetical protein [Ktedonobacterales bacterium]